MAKKLQMLALFPLAVVALLASGCTSGDDSTSSTTSGDSPTTAVDETSSTTDGTDSSSSTETTSHSDSENSECYVHLFDSDNFKASDSNFKLTKPGKYADLGSLPGADEDWTDEADSIKVGGGATVTIWPEIDFNGASQKLEPGSEHPDVDEEPSSLEMTC